MNDEQEDFDLEDVYDEEISPLMAKIIAICKKHKIPVLASFNYATYGDDDAFCTTFLGFERRQPAGLSRAFQEVKKPVQAVAIMITGPKQ